MARKRKNRAPKSEGTTKKPRKEDEEGKLVEITVPEKESKEKTASKEEVTESEEETAEEDCKKEAVPESDARKEPVDSTSIYEFKAKDITGKEVPLDKYKGHVCIIVNVASRCGHTKLHYEQLVELHNKYAESKGLKILAFPCNQFGKQEPGTPAAILEFCKKRNVEFDLFDKIDVNGKDAHPLWKFMQEKIPDEKGKMRISWNFTKFIIDKEGNVVERHKPGKKPLQMVESLEKYW